MSRRSRKRQIAGERRWLGKAAIALLVFTFIGFCVAYAVLRSYLHGDSFRRFLSAEASGVAGVTGEFAPFQWEGLAVDTHSFEAAGTGPVTSVKAEGLHTEIGLGGVRRGVWEVKGTELRRLRVSLNTVRENAASAGNAVVRAEIKKKSNRPAWFPSEAELQGIDIRDLAVEAVLSQGLANASGMRVHAEQVGAAYRGEILGGRVKLPFATVPELRVERVKARYQDRRVFLTSATLGAWQDGSIEGSGEWDLAGGQFAAEGRADGMKCDEILNENWSRRLTGDASSNFTLDNAPGHLRAQGDLTVRNGVLTALPMLDALAAYADTRRFRVLTLTEARTGWLWEDGGLTLTDLVLSSEGLVRLEGGIVIRGGKLDGAFRLGLAPGTLATIPGAETDVFAPGTRGLLWTTLRVTGTLEDPEEDLTERLIAAAGLRMFDSIPETGEKVIKFSRSVLGDRPADTVEKGVKIIGEGGKVVREVGGILDGILGGGREKERE